MSTLPDGYSPEVTARIEAELQATARIVVSEAMESPHRLIRGTVAYLRRKARGTKDDREPETAVDLRVGPDTLDRALRIMDALLNALDSRGYAVEVTAPQRLPSTNPYRTTPEWKASETRTRVRDESIPFWIEEGYDVIALPVPPPPKKPSPWYTPPRPEKERRPNGKLVLRFDTNWRHRQRHSWGDGKQQRVEDCLNDFISSLIDFAERERLYRIAADEQRRAQAEERRRWEEEQERERRHGLLCHDLESRARDWVRVRAIRKFIAAVEADAVRRSGAIEPSSDMGRWLVWARRRADEIEADAVQNVLKTREPAAEGTTLARWRT